MKSGLDGFGLFICGQADTSVGVHGIICGLVVVIRVQARSNPTVPGATRLEEGGPGHDTPTHEH